MFDRAAGEMSWGWQNSLVGVAGLRLCYMLRLMSEDEEEKKEEKEEELKKEQKSLMNQRK